MKKCGKEYKEIKKQWDEIKTRNTNERIQEFIEEYRDSEIRIAKDNGFFRMYLFNLSIVSLWFLSGIINRSLLVILPICIHEIIKAPIRLTIDYLSNSFNREVGVCW